MNNYSKSLVLVILPLLLSPLPLLAAGLQFSPSPTITFTQSLTVTASHGIDDGTEGAFIVAWSSANATSCTLYHQRPDGTYNGPQGVSPTPIPWTTGTSGSQSASPYQIGMHHWSIDCTGPGGVTHKAFDHSVVRALNANDDVLLAVQVPSTMDAGKRYQVSITFKNTGTKTWTKTGNYRLGSQNPQDNLMWGIGRAPLPSDVVPGATVTIPFTVTAPSTVGPYNFQWQMLQERIEWFGQKSGNVTVGVTASCTFNGKTIAHGQSVNAYQSQKVAFGQTCISQTRTCTNGALSGSYQYASCTQGPVPLVVGPSSHVVVMEYEAWFNPRMNPQIFATAAYQPTLTSTSTSVGYDSTDPKVIDQHIRWLTDLGVDAIIAEQTNGGPCDYGDAQVCAKLLGSSTHVAEFTANIHAINQGTFNLYPAFEQRGAPIKLIPMVDGQDALMYQPRGDGQTPFDVQMGAYYQRVTQYPDLSVIYQGKPLLLVYLGAGQNPSDPKSVYNQAQTAIQKWQNRFTIRMMAGLIDSQSFLWNKAWGVGGIREVNPTYQIWTWIDRYNPRYNLLPSYTMAGGRVEAFTVTSAVGGTYGEGANTWNAADATLYHNGATLSAFFGLAHQLDPIFLIFNQFNEYAAPDEGVDIEHSNDIEPTKQWGTAKFDVAKQNLQTYRTGNAQVIPPVFADPKTSFFTSLYNCILGRNPDPVGLRGWVGVTSTTSISYFYKSFFGSAEYVSRATTNQIYTQQLFQCVLGRTGSAQDITVWANAVASTSRASALDSILGSSEFRTFYGKFIQTQTGFTW